MRKLIIYILLLLSSSNYSIAQSNISVDWIDTPTEVSESVVTVKLGIKANSQITDVNFALNGQVSRGISAVSNDGYDIKKSQVFNLKKGENVIDVTVTTVSGSKKFSKNIRYSIHENVVVVNDYGNFECLDSMIVAAYCHNPEAEYYLGKSYLEGKNGFQKDLFEASLWFKKSAEHEYAASQYEFSISLFEGRGIYVNVESALIWLGQSVKQDYPAALLKMGELYETGFHVKKDIEKAVSLYKKCPLHEAKERLKKLGR